MRIKGSGEYTDAKGRNYTVLGVGDVSDDEKLRRLSVSGNVSFDKLSCDRISVSGRCEGDSIFAKSLEISGALSIENISCDKIDISGKPQIETLTADEISIATRNGFIGNINCKRLKIYDSNELIVEKGFENLFVGHFSLSKSNSRIRIKSIEADKVELENCEVDVIRCKDAFIGANCVIDKLFVSGECSVMPGSKVGETVRT